MDEIIELLEKQYTETRLISLDPEQARRLIVWMKVMRDALSAQSVFVEYLKRQLKLPADGAPPSGQNPDDETP